MPSWSVVICCANAEATLPAALASAAWADEVVVVDSGSKDRTAAIAQEAGAVYRLEPWRGYSGQKKFGAGLASHDWVFVLDGDEEVSPGLATEIGQLTDAQLNALDLLYVRRRNWVLGRVVRAWWPDWQSRLIHRGRVRFPDEALHEDRVPTDPSRVRRLSGWIEHKRAGPPDFADYFSGARMDERLLLVARQMHARGKRVGFLGLWLRPELAFFKFFILKRGFVDGSFGLLIAQKAYVSTQLRYAALWAVQHGVDHKSVDQSGDESSLSSPSGTTRYLFTVDDRFELKNRGLVVTPGLSWKGTDEGGYLGLKVGSCLVLEKPDGTRIDSRVAGLEILDPNPKGLVPILLADVQKPMVPIGTKVYLGEEGSTRRDDMV